MTKSSRVQELGVTSRQDLNGGRIILVQSALVQPPCVTLPARKPICMTCPIQIRTIYE
jgi:hypothetical protein